MRPDKPRPLRQRRLLYGLRNVQGSAWDGFGRLWATEHGRSGTLSGFDELNLIEPGKNYGWPVIEGSEQLAGMVASVINSGPDETWAPAGAAIVGDRIFFAGLRGESLYEARITSAGEVESLIANFKSDFGRLRGVQIGPDGFIYVTTSNRDGRGAPRRGDDKLLRFNPVLFK